MTPETRAPDAPLAEVEWRVDGRPNGNRCRYVPYLSATTVARLLDEWVGPARWKDDYEQSHLGKGLWGIVSIQFGDEWVTKKDVGVPSQFEAEKGTVSDAFKRVACIKWGVGRNVYSLPNVWAPCRVDDKGRAWPTDATLPAIRNELKKLGYEAESGRLSAPDESDQPSKEEVSSPDAAAGSTPPKKASQRVASESSQVKPKTPQEPGHGPQGPSAAEGTPADAAASPATAPRGEEAQAEPALSVAGPSPWAAEALQKMHDEGKQWALVYPKAAKVAKDAGRKTPGNWKQLLHDSELHVAVCLALGEKPPAQEQMPV